MTGPWDSFSRPAGGENSWDSFSSLAPLQNADIPALVAARRAAGTAPPPDRRDVAAEQRRLSRNQDIERGIEPDSGQTPEINRALNRIGAGHDAGGDRPFVYDRLHRSQERRQTFENAEAQPEDVRNTMVYIDTIRHNLNPQNFPWLYRVDQAQPVQLTEGEIADIVMRSRDEIAGMSPADATRYLFGARNVRPDRNVAASLGQEERPPAFQADMLDPGSGPDHDPITGRSRRERANMYDTTPVPLSQEQKDDILYQRRAGRYFRNPVQPTGPADAAYEHVSRDFQRLISGYDTAWATVAEEAGFHDSARLHQRWADLRTRASNRAIAGEVSSDDVWDHPTAANVSQFIAEQGLESTPEMATAILSLPIYTVSLAGQTAQQRSQSDHREYPDMTDVLVSLPTSVVSGALERMPLVNIIERRLGHTAAQRILAGIATEGGTEFLQNPVQYAGGTIGTQEGFDPEEALKQGVLGALAGAGMGGGLAGGVEGAHGGLHAARGGDRGAAIREMGGARFDPAQTDAAAVTALNPNGYDPSDPTNIASLRSSVGAQSPLAPRLGIKEQAQATPPDITPQDVASPLPTDLIAAGRKAADTALAETHADQLLNENIGHGIGDKVSVTLGGQERTGTIRDAFTEEDPETGQHHGAVIDWEGAGQTRERFADLSESGARFHRAERPGERLAAAPAREIVRRHIAQAESGGNVNAANPRSTASGLFQILDSTFRHYYEQVYGRDPGEHPDRAVKDDPAVQNRLMDRMLDDYEHALRAHGHEVTAGNLYLNHFLGTGGANTILSNPNAPIESLVDARVIHANPFLRGMTGADVAAWAARRMGGHLSPEQLASGATAPTDEGPQPDFSWIDRPVDQAGTPATAPEVAPTVATAAEGDRGPAIGRGDETASPEFRSWFGDSRVLDSEGAPLTVYHATRKSFEQFSLGRSEGGFFFAPSPDEAYPHNRGALPIGRKRTISAYVSLQNPLDIGRDDIDFRKVTMGATRAYREGLQARGYDGVILRNDDGSIREVVAFDPSQIRRVTDVLQTGDGTRAAPITATTAEHVDLAAQNAAQPTEAQAEAGNYQKGHVRVQGLDISIENAKGSERSGVDPNGEPWTVTMPATYGYLKRSEGQDGEQVDVYVGDHPTAPTVYVIDQVHADTKAPDEHKAMIGFPSEEAAIATYHQAFSDGKGPDRVGAVTPMDMGQFKEWLKGDTTVPAAANVPATPESAPPARETQPSAEQQLSPEITPPAASEPTVTVEKNVIAIRNASEQALGAIREALPARTRPMLRSDGAFTLPRKYEPSVKAAIANLRGVDVTPPNENDARSPTHAGIQNLDRNQEALLQSEVRGISSVRGSGDKPSPALDQRFSSLPEGDRSAPDAEAHGGSDRRNERIRAGEYSVGDAEGAGIKQAGVQQATDIPGKNANNDRVGSGTRDQQNNGLVQAREGNERGGGSLPRENVGASKSTNNNPSGRDSDSGGVGEARRSEALNVPGTPKNRVEHGQSIDASKEAVQSEINPVDQAKAALQSALDALNGKTPEAPVATPAAANDETAEAAIPDTPARQSLLRDWQIERDLGRKPNPAWIVRRIDDKSIVTWSAKHAAALDAAHREWNPEELEIARVLPKNLEDGVPIPEENIRPVVEAESKPKGVAEPAAQFDIWNYVNAPEPDVRRDTEALPPRRGGSVRALGIADDLRRERSATLVGRTVGSPEELAHIAQVYRDPRFETLRVFFMKGNEIVHATGVSSRLPGSAPLLPNNLAYPQFAAWLRQTMGQVEADGFYMLHNHPSGDPNPSRDDSVITRNTAVDVAGFRGHVVINSNKFAVIDEHGNSTVYQKNFGEDRLLAASIPHPVLGQVVSNFPALAAVGKMVQMPGHVTLIAADAKLKVRALVDYPETDLHRPPMILAAGLRRVMRRSGADRMFIVASREAIEGEAVQRALANGLLTEALDHDGQSSGVLPAGGRFFDDRTKGRFVAEDGPQYQHTFENPETEKRWQEARKGVGAGERVIAKTKAVWQAVANGFSRHWKHLPNEPRFSDLQQQLRKLENVPEVAKETAVRLLRNVVSTMTKPEYDLFARKVVLDDLEYEVAQGHDLPFGLNSETLPVERARIDEQIAANPKLVEALKTRRLQNKVLTDELVAEGVLSRDQVANPAYFRHMVLDYARAERNFARGAGSKISSPWWAKRAGSNLDINANFLEAEADWMLKAMVDVQTAKTIRFIKESDHNIRDGLRDQARASNSEKLGAIMAANPDLAEQETLFRQRIAMGLETVRKAVESASPDIPPLIVPAHLRKAAESLTSKSPRDESIFPLLAWMLDNNKPGAEGAAMALKAISQRKSWAKSLLGERYVNPDNVKALAKRFAPEGHVAWQPREGRHLFTAKTVPEHVLDRLINSLADQQLPGIPRAEMELALQAIRPQLVVGGDRYTMVIPKEVADTLDEFGDAHAENVFGRAFAAVQGAWKQWTLINFRRFFKYNLNNAIGDFDAVMAGHPATLLKMGRATSEIYNVMVKGVAPSQEYQDAFERAVFTSGLSFQEIPDINKLSALRHLTDERSNRPDKLILNAAGSVWRALQGATNFRETLMRYAAYLSYLEKMNAGQTMEQIGYGASLKNMVDAVADPRDRAALMARDLIGDYGSISVVGAFLRKYIIPFWSWKEINTKRYWRLTGNAFRESKAKGVAVGGALGASIAVRTAVGLTIRMAMVYGLIQLWNHLLFGDDEDRLSEQQRRQLHLLLGRDSDGNIISLKMQGALSDVLGELGFPDAVAGIRRAEAGQGTYGQAAVDTLKAPINTSLTSITPFVGEPLEQAMNIEPWPDLFAARPIRDRWRHLFSAFSLENEYDVVADRPSRGYAHSWADAFVYRHDPGEMAYNDIRGMTYDFMERTTGESGSTNRNSPRSSALRDYRMALRYGDQARAQEALQEYRRYDGTSRGLHASIARADPLGAIPRRLRAAFLATLTDDQRVSLQDAEEWYREQYLRHRQGER